MFTCSGAARNAALPEKSLLGHCRPARNCSSRPNGSPLAATMFATNILAKPAVVASRSYQRCNVVCMASTPRQKSTKRHVRARPIKYTPADKNRKPHQYEPLPPPPPEVVLVSKASQ